MTISLKHHTQAAGTDAGTGEIHKAQWNENHDLTLAADRILGRLASAGAVQELTAQDIFTLANNFDWITGGTVTGSGSVLSNGEVRASILTNGNQKVRMYYDGANNTANIQGIEETVGFRRLRLNPLGGEASAPSISTTASSANLFVDNADGNNFLRSTSSKDFKTDIQPIPLEKAKRVLSFTPIEFKSLAPADNPDYTYYGLTAEAVAKVEPRLVHFGYRDKDYRKLKSGDRRLRKTAKLVPDGVQYDRITVLLLRIVQDQQERIEKLETALNKRS